MILVGIRQAIPDIMHWRFASTPTPQESFIYRHATEVHDDAGIGSVSSFQSPPRPAAGQAPPVVYELRSYQLHPGYQNVPQVVNAFQSG